MAGTISTKMELRGDKEYRDAIKQITQESKNLSSELKAVESSLDSETSAQDKAAQKADVLSRQIETQEKYLQTLNDELQKVAPNSEAAFDIQDKVNKATVALNRMKAEMESVPSRAQLMGDSMIAAGKKIESVGSAITGVGKNLTLGLTAPLVAAAAASIKAASDYEENINKVDVAFGDYAGTVEKWAETATDAFGLSKNSALEAAALFGDMGTSMGITQEEAAKMAVELAGLAGDLASFKNISTDEAMTALKSVFTGETESLKNLGIVMTQTNLKAFAEDMGKVYDSMSESEKVTLRYQYVLSRTTNAQGDYSRTADGTANSVRTYTQSVENLGVAFGEVLLPEITPLINKATDLIKQFSKLSDSEKQQIVRLAAIAAGIGPVTLAVGKTTEGVGKLVQGLGTLSQNSETIKTTLASAASSFGVAGLAATAATVAVVAIGKAYKDWYDAEVAAADQTKATRDAVNNSTNALVSANDALRSSMSETAQSVDTATSKTQAIDSLSSTIENLASKSSRTAAEQSELRGAIGELNALVPDLNLAWDDQAQALNMSSDALASYLDNAKNLMMLNAYKDAISDMYDEVAAAEVALIDAQNKQQEANDALADSEKRLTDTHDEFLEAGWDDAEKKFYGNATAAGAATTEVYNNQKAVEDNAAAVEAAKTTLEDAKTKLGLYEDGYKELSSTIETATETQTDSAAEMQKAYDETYQSAYESIMGQINLLNEWSGTSFENMQASLQSNLDAMAQYNAAIAGMGGETSASVQQVIGYFQSMGTEGVKYINALWTQYQSDPASAIAYCDQLLGANTTAAALADSLANAQAKTETGWDGIAATSGQAAEKAGTDAASAYSQGVQNGQEEATNAGQTIGTAATTAASAAQAMQAGQTVGGNYSSGLAATSERAQTSGAVVAGSAGMGLRSVTASAYTWGYDMGLQFAAGLAATVSTVSASAQSVANAAAAYIHHSTPDKGPLAGDDRWGYELAENFANGMSERVGMVRRAALSLATAAAFSPGVGGIGGGSVTNMGGFNITVNAAQGQNVSAIADAVAAKIQKQVTQRRATY